MRRRNEERKEGERRKGKVMRRGGKEGEREGK